MTKTPTKAKKMTLRQNLRLQSEGKLTEIVRLVNTAVGRALEEADVELNPSDVMRYCLGGQTKTVHDQLITDLANNAEAELMKLWNDQQTLDLGDDDAKAAD